MRVAPDSGPLPLRLSENLLTEPRSGILLRNSDVAPFGRRKPGVNSVEKSLSFIGSSVGRLRFIRAFPEPTNLPVMSDKLHTLPLLRTQPLHVAFLCKPEGG